MIDSSNDLPYNFMIGGDGSVYEVRGWDFESGISDVDNKEQAFVIGFAGK